MAVSATGGVIDPSTLTMLTINRLSEGDYRFEEEVEFLDMTAEELLQESGRIKLEVTLTHSLRTNAIERPNWSAPLFFKHPVTG